MSPLRRQTAHLALAPLTYRNTRRDVLDYIGVVPVATQRFDFLVPGEKRASLTSVPSLLKPFDLGVWLCLGQWVGAAHGGLASRRSRGGH